MNYNDKSLGYIFTTGVNRGNRDMEWNRPHEYIFLYRLNMIEMVIYYHLRKEIQI